MEGEDWGEGGSRGLHGMGGAPNLLWAAHELGPWTISAVMKWAAQGHGAGGAVAMVAIPPGGRLLGSRGPNGKRRADVLWRHHTNGGPSKRFLVMDLHEGPRLGGRGSGRSESWQIYGVGGHKGERRGRPLVAGTLTEP